MPPSQRGDVAAPRRRSSAPIERPRLSRAGGLPTIAALVGWLGSVVACTGSPVPADATPAGGTGTLPTATAAELPSSALPSSPAASSGQSTLPPSSAAPSASAASSSSASVPAPHQGPLGTFYDALRRLDRGEKQHVRIVWLGDSHAQADFWPDAIRRGLQQRFGSAGPGFVHLGFKSYRHAGIKTDIQGKWRMRPKQPSTVEPWGDGAFGLGGILHAGWADRRRASVELTDERLAGRRLRWDLCYKHGLAADRFRVQLGDAPEQSFTVDGEDEIGKLQHLELEGRGLATLTVAVDDGRPDFCGLVIETVADDHPGVVLDNLGINGARYGTALAWNEQAWATEVRRRSPDLFIFEYGGNEAGDGVITPDRYRKQALELIARARRIRPELSCLVIGPSDRVDAESKIPPIVTSLESAASEADCMFWNTYQVMGGRGSLARWREDQRAAPDGIHLKPKGYAEVGALLLGDLMAGYQP